MHFIEQGYGPQFLSLSLNSTSPMDGGGQPEGVPERQFQETGVSGPPDTFRLADVWIRGAESTSDLMQQLVLKVHFSL